MDITLWIVAGLLALAFLGAGTMKLSRSKEQLAASGMSWTEDFSAPMVKTIGSLEILGALGLVLPALVPVAALGLTATMIGAIVVHLRRREAFTPAAVLLVLAAFVAIGRFLVPFGG